MTVSVLIPTNLNERLAWLKHRLNFLYKLGHAGETMIGVWAGHEKIDDLRSFCAALSPHIVILSQDGEQRFTTRLGVLAAQATGAYVVTQGDDDFLLPASFPACIKLLEDPSVSCAQGRLIVINADLAMPIGLGPYPTWQAPEHDVLTRFSTFMRHFGSTFHAMYRRPQFIERAAVMDDVMQRTHNLVFFEYVGEIFSVIKGRFVVSEEISLVKGLHDKNTSTVFRTSLSTKMAPHLVLSDHFTSDYKVLESWVFHLLESMGVAVSEDIIRKQVLDGMVDYLGWLLFKRRDMIEAAEVEIDKRLRQSPPPPLINTLVGLIDATRV